MPFNHHGTDLRFADVPEAVANGSAIGTRTRTSTPASLIHTTAYTYSTSIIPPLKQLQIEIILLPKVQRLVINYSYFLRIAKLALVLINEPHYFEREEILLKVCVPLS